MRKMYCYFRMAERSVDSLLADPGQWPAFVAYLDEQLGPLRSLVETLAEPWPGICEREDRYTTDGIPDIKPTRLILNRIVYMFTGKVCLTRNDIKYILNAYGKLVSFVRSDSFDARYAVSVRMAMYNCQFIIRRSTICLFTKYKYIHIAYFNQTPYVRHWSVPE